MALTPTELLELQDISVVLAEEFPSNSDDIWDTALRIQQAMLGPSGPGGLPVFEATVADIKLTQEQIQTVQGRNAGENTGFREATLDVIPAVGEVPMGSVGDTIYVSTAPNIYSSSSVVSLNPAGPNSVTLSEVAASVARTVPPASGGMEVNNIVTGAGFERVLTLSDLGGSGITVQDEGTPLATVATTLNFTGAGVTASGAGATKVIDIPNNGDVTGPGSSTLNHIPTFADATGKLLQDSGVIISNVVQTSRTINSGAGLINGGDLSANRTLDVGANADGSIQVNADDIQVGILATDAQHGTRGGGTQHALAIAAGAAGFLSGADKTKLDNTSGTNTGDVTLGGTLDYITLVGQVLTRNPIDLATDITGQLDLTTDVTGQLPTGNIADDAVTYAKIQNVVANNVFLGNDNGAASEVQELTGTEATVLLDVFTAGLKGLAPASGGGTANFLRADGTWAAPPGTQGGGGVGLPPNIVELTNGQTVELNANSNNETFYYYDGTGTSPTLNFYDGLTDGYTGKIIVDEGASDVNLGRGAAQTNVFFASNRSQTPDLSSTSWTVRAGDAYEFTYFRDDGGFDIVYLRELGGSGAGRWNKYTPLSSAAVVEADDQNAMNRLYYFNGASAPDINFYESQDDGAQMMVVVDSSSAAGVTLTKGTGQTAVFFRDSSDPSTSFSNLTIQPGEVALITRAATSAYYVSRIGRFNAVDNSIYTKVKTADETVTNDALLSNDSELTFSNLPAGRYAFEALIFYASLPTPDFQYSFGGTNIDTINSRRDDLHLDLTGTLTLGNGLVNYNLSVQGTGLIETARVNGYVEFTSDTNSFNFLWAQNTSDPGSTTVYEGSWVKLSPSNT